MGFGGQTKPVFHKKAKTTRKVVLRLEANKWDSAVKPSPSFTKRPKQRERLSCGWKQTNGIRRSNQARLSQKGQNNAKGCPAVGSKQMGFGGQTKPVFHKKAKTTRKVVLR